MKIGLIGAGNVGGTLGRGWTAAGHEVMYGVRTPQDSKFANLTVGTNAGAASFGSAVVFATPWEATAEAIRAAGNLRGRIVLDCTNPVKDGLSGLTTGEDSSGGEQVAQWAPGARVVKIFNTVGYNVMGNPRFGTERAAMLYCGDDAEAKSVAASLASDLGFEPVDVGPLSEARWLEAFALLWIRMAVFHGFGREFAFKLMRR